MAGSRQSRADDSYGWVAPKPCGRIGRERRLCRVKAVRMYRALAKALSCRSCTDGSEGFAVSKPYGHIGQELRLSRAKAQHKRADRPGGRG